MDLFVYTVPWLCAPVSVEKYAYLLLMNDDCEHDNDNDTIINNIFYDNDCITDNGNDNDGNIQFIVTNVDKNMNEDK